MTFNTSTNQLTQIGSLNTGYDAAGDLTSDGTNTYGYDAEGRLISVNGTSWTGVYNALGQRVQRNSGAGLDEFTYDPFGQELGNFNGGNGTWWEQYVRFGGHIAWYYNPSSSTSRYFHANGLGSLLTGTDQTGAYQETMLNYPFGESWQNLGFAWDEKWAQFPVFDNDIGLEMADNRLQNPLLGRWMTPDPAGLAAADPTNPQSFNRYAYVLNNPTSMVDPSGLVNCEEFGQSDCDCPPDSVDCCDPFSGDPDCPIQGGGPIGGIGDGGGGSISSPPTPTPNCDLYGDPLQCQGIDNQAENLSDSQGCHGGTIDILPFQGQQIIKASHKFFNIPYHSQVCNQFVCNSINASGVLPNTTVNINTGDISQSPYFRQLKPGEIPQAGDVYVFSGPPAHMGLYDTNPPPPPTTPPSVILSATEHGGANNHGGPRWGPVRWFRGSAIIFRIQVPCP